MTERKEYLNAKDFEDGRLSRTSHILLGKLDNANYEFKGLAALDK